MIGCKSRKNKGDQVNLKNKSSKELVAYLKISEIHSDWMSSKGNAEVLFRDEKNTVRTNLRMRVDSATWISLSKATVPIFSGLLSNDSLKGLIRFPEKQYFLEDFKTINQLINSDVEYELLQEFFLGNPVFFDFDQKYKVSIDNNAYLMSSEKSKNIEKLIQKGKLKDEEILYRCWVEPEIYKCKKVIINLIQQETELEINYSDWEEFNGKKFPMKSSIKVTTIFDTAQMDINYSRVEFGKKYSMPFKIPSTYKKITLKK